MRKADKIIFFVLYIKQLITLLHNNFTYHISNKIIYCEDLKIYYSNINKLIFHNLLLYKV